jgi:translation initiation factor IF-3
MDFKRHRYELEQKARESKKKQVNAVLKEVRFRLKIDENDFEIKKKRAVKFLENGDKVKITLQLRGRELGRPALGFQMLSNIADELQNFGVVESEASSEGRNMSMVFRPIAKKQKSNASSSISRKQSLENRLARQKARLEKKNTGKVGVS